MNTDAEKNKREWVDALDVYSQYFHAHAACCGGERRAALIKLTLLKDAEGMTAYQASASFMPFEDEEDFRVPEDVRVEKIVFEGKKRRNKKKEKELLGTLQEEIEGLLPSLDAEAEVFWDAPLREARYS